MTISALIVARNEEKKIEKCLSSLNFVDEIVVILDRSTDKTFKICKMFSNKVFTGKWTCEGERRNFGIKKCSSEWIFEIDADEIISRDLAREVKKKIRLHIGFKNIDYLIADDHLIKDEERFYSEKIIKLNTNIR